MAALLGGQITMAFVDATAAYPHLKSDKINVLAITGAQRHPALPQVPTMTEAGYPGLEANGWFGTFLPASTPKPIVDKLGAEIASIVKSPEIHKRLTEMGLIPVGSLPAEFKAQIEKDAVHWKNVVEAAKISLD
jgi:tripartite-type tricarboxylate transporter receptor subunit TctC